MPWGRPSSGPYGPAMSQSVRAGPGSKCERSRGIDVSDVTTTSLTFQQIGADKWQGSRGQNDEQEEKKKKEKQRRNAQGANKEIFE